MFFAKSCVVSVAPLRATMLRSPRKKLISPVNDIKHGMSYHKNISDGKKYMNLGSHSSLQSRRPLVICQSFLGVGAPEAVLVVIVALVLFGPKGLAEAAKGLGQTVKTFAPTIRELNDISSDLKSTLEEEIGLNDLKDELQNTIYPAEARARPQDIPSTSSVVKSNQVDEDPDIEAKRLESSKLAWGEGTSASPLGGEMEVNKLNSNLNLDSLSLEQLEEEIARRKSSPN